jgi:hypothetical protein
MNNLFRQLPALLAALLAAATPAPARQAPTNGPGDCVFFRDGGSLFGKLLEAQPGGVILWKHADAAKTIELKPESVTQIDFATPTPLAARAPSSCKLWLANGDALTGNAVSCDRDFLTFDTWYAGRLKIPRRALQTLAFNPRTPMVFDGLGGLEGWTQGNSVKSFPGESGQWMYRNGGFYADKAASIARDLKLPDRAQMQFDLVWRGTLNLAIALYTDSLQPILLSDKENGPDFGGFYSLLFNNAVFVTLRPIKKKEPVRALGDTLIVQALAQKVRVHVDLRMSKPDRRVALLLDGALVRDWIDPGGFAGEGTGVRFVNNGGGAIKLSHLSVSKWNGVLDEGSAEPSDPSHDVVSVESGGKISGAVTGIAGGQISMLTASGTRSIRLDTVNAIEFARFQGEAPAAPAANVHATFVQGGGIALELLGWRPEGVEAVSPYFGKATFDPAAFSRLQFVSSGPKKPEAPRE